MERHTLVEEGTEFKGSLASKCPVVVKGKVDGDIAAPALSVSGSGSVHGAVKVEDLRSEGELSGEIHATTMQLSGSVRDNTVLRAGSLEVRLAGDGGGLVFGECTLEVGDPSASREAGKVKPKAAEALEAALPRRDGKKRERRAPAADDVAAAPIPAAPGGILTAPVAESTPQPATAAEPNPAADAVAADDAVTTKSLSQPPPV